jgi:hypothetical protein
VKLQKKSDYFVSNAVIRYYYGSMLLEFPTEDVREFFQGLPLTIDGKQLTERELFDFVWDEKKRTPLSYMCVFNAAIEPFCIKKGMDCLEFVHKTFKKNVLLEPGTLLAFLERVGKLLLPVADFKGIFSKNMHVIAKKICSVNYQRCIRVEKKRDGTVKMMYAFACDHSFQRSFKPYFEMEFCFAPQHKYLPCRFGDTPFNGYEINAELPGVYDLIDSQCEPRIHGGIFSIGRHRLGHTGRFFEYLKNNAITLIGLDYCPDPEVVIMDEDYYCPVRKRVVLKKGRMYGAPVALMTFWFKPKSAKPRFNPLAKIADELIHPEQTIFWRVKQKHEALLRSLSPSIVVEYDTVSSSVFCNKRFVTSGIQGRILQHIIKAYVDEGRTEFQRREFVIDRDLITSETDSGFSTRLNRIIICLETGRFGMEIRKKAKGKFEFIAAAVVELRTTV